VHGYPGSVNTGLYRDMKGPPFDPKDAMPIEECGERQLYLASSARFPPKYDESMIVTGYDVEVAVRSTGEVGSGVYSVGKDCESASSEVGGLLAGLRESGMVEEAWRHTELEFKRITEG
jgi:hypothetical protein